MINKEAIYHVPYSKWAYQNSANELTLMVRTQKNNVKEINIRSGDPFRWLELNGQVIQNIETNSSWSEEPIVKASKFASDSMFDYWIGFVSNKYKRIRYGFEIISDDEKLIYTEGGFFSSTTVELYKYGFTWGYLNEGNIIVTPDWVKRAVFYQIFPERFENGGHHLKMPNLENWETGEPTPQNYFGGDLKGIIKRISHLKDLGINALYLTPIFKANTNHKYDTESYHEICPYFGDEADFDELVKVCHENDIKVMLDAVFNHSGFKFPYWQDVLKNKEKSIYKDWFFINDFSKLKEEYEGKEFILDYPYETFAYVPHMPRLNWSNKGLKNHLLDSVVKWTTKGIDGWRLDVANEPSLEFWRQFRFLVKSISPDIYILGEVWYDSNLYLQGDVFDSVMNYPLRFSILDFYKKKLDFKNFMSYLTQSVLLYTQTVQKSLFNVLGSHDTSRIMTELNNDKELFKSIYALLFCFPGTISIYYGDEIGMDGGNDPGCRKPMVWNKDKWDHDLLNFFKKIISFRKSNNLIQEGYTALDYSQDLVLKMKRYNSKESLNVIVNFNQVNKTISLDKNSKILNLITMEEIQSNSFEAIPYQVYIVS